jgi:YjbE family integral membrane protein
MPALFKVTGVNGCSFGYDSLRNTHRHRTKDLRRIVPLTQQNPAPTTPIRIRFGSLARRWHGAEIGISVSLTRTVFLVSHFPNYLCAPIAPSGMDGNAGCAMCERVSNGRTADSLPRLSKGLTMLAWLQQEFFALINVIMIDVVLAGDNAIIVGMAASRVAPEMRSRVIFWGIAGAVALRILFAGVTAQLLTIVGLTLAGGILLLWVCWKMYRQITEHAHADSEQAAALAAAFGQAVTQVVLADVTMSLDNVLAVAGAAKGSFAVLAIGLFIAIVLMAVASHYIASLLGRYPWITWIGLLIIVYVALSMIWDGWHQIGRAYPPLSLQSIRTTLGLP